MSKEITVFDTVAKNGKTYKNISLVTKVKDGEVIQGIEPGSSIVVEKLFKKGNPVQSFGKTSYAVVVKMGEEQVGFFLKEDEHTVFEQIAEQGENVKITMNKKAYEAFTTNDGKEVAAGTKMYPVFEKV